MSLHPENHVVLEDDSCPFGAQGLFSGAFADSFRKVKNMAPTD